MRFHHTTLDNGLEVIGESSDTARSTAVGFFAKAGSRDEPPELSGVSHFLEHMAFKGGPKRDALAVNRDFDRVGAKHNAETSEESTIYYAACLPEYLSDTMDVLADILRPKLLEEDFETEKEVIIEEIRMYLDSPLDVAFDEARTLHFGAHPLGRSILGSVESISAMTVEGMRNYYRDRYGPSNLTLAFAGRGDWDEWVELAKRHCGDWTGIAAPRALGPAKGTGAFKRVIRPEDQQQTFIAMSDAPPLESASRHAAALAAAMIGDSTGSRLFWELVDPGLAEYCSTYYQVFNQAGAMTTAMGCDAAEAPDRLARLADAMSRIGSEGFSERELRRAKNKVRSRLVTRAERPMGRLMPLGYYWTYLKTYIPVRDETDAYERVTLDEVRALIEQWPLTPMTIVTVGPREDLAGPFGG